MFQANDKIKTFRCNVCLEGVKNNLYMTDPIRTEVRNRLQFGPPMDDNIDGLEQEKEKAVPLIRHYRYDRSR